MPADPRHAFLRHTLATLAYRAAKALSGAPAGFSDFKEREHVWRDSAPQSWGDDVTRFFAAAVNRLDDAVARADTPGSAPEGIFKAPIAAGRIDAATGGPRVEFD